MQLHLEIALGAESGGAWPVQLPLEETRRHRGLELLECRRVLEYIAMPQDLGERRRQAERL